MSKRRKSSPPETPAAPQIATPVASADLRLRRIGITAILFSVVVAWSNSFSVPFLLDDHASIVSNATLRDFWTLKWLTPPATAGETVSGRPLLNFSFAVNHAIGGLGVQGYHLANLLIHAFSALTLFGLVRRTLLLPRIWIRSEKAPFTKSPHDSTQPVATFVTSQPECSRSAVWIALSISLLWALHPLHTGAVTYLVQRAESLAGLFYLLTLHAFVRSTAATTHAHRWSILCVVSCLLGMATKETVATVPLVVLLYDRTFIAGTFSQAWRARRGLYSALAATWLFLAALVVANEGRGGSAGLASEIQPWSYFLTQCEAIPRYLQLAFWPASQVFDYGTPTVSNLSEVLPQFLLLSLLALAACWALYRNRPVGFLGATFFLLLAPSSSFIPVATQTIAEHRMYLPLVPVVTFIALVGRCAFQRVHTPRLGFLVVPLLALTLGAVTFARNDVYRSALTLWQDTAMRRPENPRAHNNLGLAFSAAGREPEAIAAFEQAIALQPNHAFAHFNLGTALLARQRFAEAADHFESALAADPTDISARMNLGRALTHLGRKQDAIGQYRMALAQDDSAQDVRTNLAALLIEQREVAEAETLLRTVLSAQPELAEAHYQLGLARERSGDAATAEAAFRESLRLKPDLPVAHLALGNTLARRGQSREAEVSYREAIRLNPRLAEAHYALGNLFAKQKQFTGAMDAYRIALSIEPGHVQALNNLANCQMITGQLEEAVKTYQAVLQLTPNDSAVQRNLELARELIRTAGQGTFDRK